MFKLKSSSSLRGFRGGRGRSTEQADALKQTAAVQGIGGVRPLAVVPAQRRSHYGLKSPLQASAAPHAIASHLSSGNSSAGATCWMPALLTRRPTVTRRCVSAINHESRRALTPPPPSTRLHSMLPRKVAAYLVDCILVAEAVQPHVGAAWRPKRARCRGRCRSSILSRSRLHLCA